MRWAARDNKRKQRERDQQARRDRQRGEQKLGQFAKEQTYAFGNGELGSNDLHTAPMHGVTAEGQPVTAAFGQPGSKREGQTYLADGHAADMDSFWGPRRRKKHDDYDGQGGGTQRRQYTGYGS